jgi:polyisoprenoid-binding protein YceI
MKKIILFGAAVIALASCGGDAKPTVTASDAQQANANTNELVAYKVDSTSSKLTWEGYEGIAIGNPEHYGSIVINNGEINADSTGIKAGKFTINLNTLTVEDIPADSPKNAKLKGHLLDGDFFDTAKFPTASFEITGSAPKGADSVMVTGNLTLKGVAKSISIPVKVTRTDAEIKASSSKFYINRKDWGINYRSEESLGDELIRPEIGIILNVTAKK